MVGIKQAVESFDGVQHKIAACMAFQGLCLASMAGDEERWDLLGWWKFRGKFLGAVKTCVLGCVCRQDCETPRVAGPATRKTASFHEAGALSSTVC